MKALFQQALQELEQESDITAKQVAQKMGELSNSHPAQYVDYANLALLVKYDPLAESIRKSAGLY